MGNGHSGRGHGPSGRRARRHAQRQRENETANTPARNGDGPVLLSPLAHQPIETSPQNVDDEGELPDTPEDTLTSEAENDLEDETTAPHEQNTPTNASSVPGTETARRSSKPYQPGGWHTRVAPVEAHSGASERPLHPPRVAHGQDMGTVDPDQPQGDDMDEQPSVPRRDVRGEVGPLIDALHEVFERDRVIASQGQSTRCGICYLYFPLSELAYKAEEGFYCCPRCMRALGPAHLSMVHRQQKL